jgi:hypothetical protein
VNTQVQQIILILIPIVLPPLIAAAFAWGTSLFQGVLSRLPANQRSLLESLAGKSVLMAEQKLDGMSGDEKKKAAETAFFALCQHFKVPVPATAVVDAFIEAAVSMLPKVDNEDTVKVPASLPTTKS